MNGNAGVRRKDYVMRARAINTGMGLASFSLRLPNDESLADDVSYHWPLICSYSVHMGGAGRGASPRPVCTGMTLIGVQQSYP